MSVTFVHMDSTFIDQLTEKEKLDLLEALWMSLDPEKMPLPDWQTSELDRRMEAEDKEAILSLKEVNSAWQARRSG